MPSTYAHYRMGQEIKRMITGNEKTIIKNYSDLFNIGLHGPDILFYYKPLRTNKINSIGYGMHEKPGYEFFEHAASVIQKNECSQAHMVYVYGMICHFALDVTCHGYVDEKIRQSGVSHGEIEVEFDRELMVMDGLDPVRHKLTNHIVVNHETAGVIRDFYDGVTAGDIYKALEGMKFYNDLLLAPSKIKRKCIYTLLKVSGNYQEMHGLIVNYKKSEKCEDSTRRLMLLYEGAKHLAVRLIREYRKYLLKEGELDFTYQYTFGSKLVKKDEKEERIYAVQTNKS
ncbi:MAG: zinc dependent phospholipase C family protein [Hespellia sp.]|nr:zinc dependent phospholipase C family protein [Hespellia sp.]